MRKSHPLLAGIDDVKPYKLIKGEALYDVRPPIMQIEDFLPAAGVMGLTSQPGVGKTWLAMEICRAVASGTPFLNKFKTLRGGVLFVGADSSIYDYARQWTRLTRKLSTEGGPELFDPVRFHEQETFLFEDVDEIRRLIATHRKFEWGPVHDTEHGPQRERGFHVIVMDMLSALTNVPENDNTGREQVFRNMRFLAEATDAAVVILHHNAARSEFNDGTNFRGGGAQLARLDSHINLVPSRKDPYLIGCTYKKFRGIKPGDFTYRMNVSDPIVATLVVSEEPVTVEQRMVADPLAEALKKYVAKHAGQRACEMRDAFWKMLAKDKDGELGFKFKDKKKLHDSISNRLNALLFRGIVVRETNREGKSVYAMKNLTKLVQQAADVEDVGDALAAEEKPSRSTRTSAKRDTNSTKSGRSKKRRKVQRVQKRVVEDRPASSRRK